MGDGNISDELVIKSIDNNGLNTDKIVKTKKVNVDPDDSDMDLNSRSIVKSIAVEKMDKFDAPNSIKQAQSRDNMSDDSS